MYSVDELKQIIEHGKNCGVSRMMLSEKSISMDFYNQGAVEIVKIPLTPKVNTIKNSEMPVDPTLGTGFSEEELFLSAGGV